MTVRVVQGGAVFDTNSTLPFGDFNDTYRALDAPVGATIFWNKTPSWGTLSTGTADTDTANKLEDSGATFESDGILPGMIIQNTTDGTFGIVDTVDGEDTITIKADTQAGSSATDVFPDGNENYEIYGIYELGDAWYEYGNITFSDANSPLNGKTIPDYNGENRFIKTDVTSSTESAGVPHTHSGTTGNSGANVGGGVTHGVGTGQHTHPFTSGNGSVIGEPKNVTLVLIMKIK